MNFSENIDTMMMIIVLYLLIKMLTFPFIYVYTHTHILYVYVCVCVCVCVYTYMNKWILPLRPFHPTVREIVNCRDSWRRIYRAFHLLLAWLCPERRIIIIKLSWIENHPYLLSSKGYNVMLYWLMQREEWFSLSLFLYQILCKKIYFWKERRIEESLSK